MADGGITSVSASGWVEPDTHIAVEPEPKPGDRGCLRLGYSIDRIDIFAARADMMRIRDAIDEYLRGTE